MTRVLIADDQPLIRGAVADILQADSTLEVVGQACDGREAIDLAAQLRPDIVVMDIRMPNVDGIEATTALCASEDGPRVLVLTTFEEDEYVFRALRAGASGFIGKGAEPEDIVRAVRAVAAGDSLLSPTATHALITRYLQPTPSVALDERALADLTEREREILVLVARGLSNQEIAESLFISPHTAKTHVNRTMVKLHAHDRAQLVIIAYETGLLVPGA